VAWVAERKDVLSGCFFMLTLLAYAGYVGKSEARSPKPEGNPKSEVRKRQVGAGVGTSHSSAAVSRAIFHLPSSIFYLLSLLCFALGLMSKPMLVTVPFVLLLLDYWPLGRGTDRGARSAESGKSGGGPGRMRRWIWLVFEKTPFFVLSAASSVVALAAQRASESVYPLAVLPLTERMINALVAYAVYLEKTFWPFGLAVFYPLPQRLPAITGIVAGTVVLGLTVWAAALVRRRPHVPVGWFWYLGMVVPVIGLVQVGLQARADRYTCLPLIGVFILVVWEAFGLVASGVGRTVPAVATRWLSGLAAGLVLLACGLRTRDQLRHWRSSESLFRQAIAVTKDNWLSHYNLAGSLSEQGRFAEAMDEYRRAIEIHPNYAHAHINLGTLLFRQGQADEAISQWQKALEIRPRDAPTHNNLGTALLSRGRVDEAITHLQQALESDPGLALAHNSLGNALLQKGKLDEAITHFQEAIRLRPDFARAQCSLGGALLRKGQLAEALANYEAAIGIRPANPSVLAAAAWVFATCPEAGARNGPRAVELAEEAERLSGGANPAVLGTLAAAYAEADRFPEAIAAAQRALAMVAPQENAPQAQALRAQLALYHTRSPFRDPSLSPHSK